MAEQQGHRSLPTREAPAFSLTETEPRHLEYQVIRLDEQGLPVWSTESSKPALGAYLYQRPEKGIQGRFGEPGYCPGATRLHHQQSDEAGEFPRLYFLESEEAAVALGFAPCGRCWLKKGLPKETLTQRWYRYQAACEIQGVDLVEPPQSVKEEVLSGLDDDGDTLQERVKARLDQAKGANPEQLDILRAWFKCEEPCFLLGVEPPKPLPSVVRVLETLKTKEQEELFWQEADKYLEELSTIGPDDLEQYQVCEDRAVSSLARFGYRTEGELRLMFFGIKQTLKEVPDDLAKPELRRRFAERYLLDEPQRLGQQLDRLLLAEEITPEMEAFIAFAKGDERVSFPQEGLVGWVEGVKAHNYRELGSVLRLAGLAYERVDMATRQEINKLAWAVVRQTAEDYDRLAAAGWWLDWERRRFHADQQGALREGEVLAFAELRLPDSFVDLPKLLTQEEFDAVGRFLKNNLPGEAVHTYELLARSSDWSERLVFEMPRSVLEAAIDCYARIGFLRRTSTGKLKLRTTGREASLWTLGSIQNAQLAARYLRNPRAEEAAKFETLAEAAAAMEAYQEQIRVEEVVIQTDRPAVQVAYLNEVSLGHKDSDLTFLNQVVDYYRGLDPDKRPDVVVVSSLIQGGFHFTDKRRRVTLADELRSVDRQFHTARLLIDEFLSLGIKVVVNTGPDDARLWNDYAIEAMRMMRQLGGPLADAEKSHVAYYQADAMQRSMRNWDTLAAQDKTAWDFHLWFQQHVVYPYCLRLGRRLKSADEVYAQTGGQVRQEEYLLLLEAYERLENGEALGSVHEQILSPEHIPHSGQVFTDFGITDNLVLVMRMAGNEEVRHLILAQPKFGDKPRYQNASDVLIAMIGHLEAEREIDFDVLVGQNQGMGLSVEVGDRLAVLTPPLRGTHLDQRGSIMAAAGDPSWRQATTRREIVNPGILAYEHTADERLLINCLNHRFLDLARATTQREKIVPWGDWQFGSVTARPDVATKRVSMVADQLIAGEKVTLLIGGDVIHGRNYPGSDHENKRTGLISIQDQCWLAGQVIALGLERVPADKLQNLTVLVTPGNHEINSGYKYYGDTYSDFIVGTFENVFARHGVMPQSGQIKVFRHVGTDRGDAFLSPLIIAQVAQHGIASRHKVLESGGKGGSGKPAIYQTTDLVQGLGSYFGKTDLAVFYHWHYFQLKMVGDKLCIIIPGLAQASGYEIERGFRPHLGGVQIGLGGGEVPLVEWQKEAYLHHYQIPDGLLSDEALADTEGLVNHPDFNSQRHGFSGHPDVPQSALQRFWQLQILRRLWDDHAFLTTNG